MRILPIAAAAAFCLGGWLEAPAQAQHANTPRAQQSIDARVKALEKKTDYFQIKKINRTKTWARNAGKSPRANSPAPPGCDYTPGDGAGTQQREIICSTNITFDGSHPVIATVWAEWTAVIRTTQGIDYEFGGPECSDSKHRVPPSSGEIHLTSKLLCRSLINVQAGQKLQLGANFFTQPPNLAPDLIVESVTLNVSVLTEVLTDYQ